MKKNWGLNAPPSWTQWRKDFDLPREGESLIAQIRRIAIDERRIAAVTSLDARSDPSYIPGSNMVRSTSGSGWRKRVRQYIPALADRRLSQ